MMRKLSRIVAAVAASVMLAAIGMFDAHAASASETQHFPLCHRHNGNRVCVYAAWSPGVKMAAPSTSRPAGFESSKGPRIVFVGDPFWINTTPGVEAFGIPAAGCTPVAFT